MPASLQPDPPRRTVRMAAVLPAAVPTDAHSTDYELSASVLLPPLSAVRAVDPPAPPSPRLPLAAATPSAPRLDPETRALFQHRLRLCCLIAAVPLGFLVTSAATNFIHLLGREAVGVTGLGLAAVTLAGLAATASYLTRRPSLAENALRVAEVGVFGAVGGCFAYWQFAVLTAVNVHGWDRLTEAEVAAVEQSEVLAAALFVHFCWFALVVFHGVLVPNTPARGAGVAVGMCLLALAISGVAAAVHPPTGRNAGVLFAVSVTVLAAGAGLSIFGTAKTQALREEVRTAREAVRELGQYRLRRKLGQGGMGEVYLAEHSLLKRPCAVKRIHPKFLDHPEQVRRFQREVEATARLRHPNTVEVYDYGRADDGTFYYVMEYVPGQSLEEIVLKAGPLPPGRVVHVLRQVCGALREAHRMGLVHRDIKPSNILLCPDGSPHDQAKLVDFGLVHSAADAAADQHKLTRDGLIVGTPEYMSPEQASGGPLDGRSDLFSLGSVGYFLLTGKEAFHRGNPVQTLMAVVGEEPQPVARTCPSAPADLLAVLRKCLAKLPADRYQRASEVEADLSRCDCRSDWTEELAAEWWARRGPLADLGTDLNALPLRESGGG